MDLATDNLRAAMRRLLLDQDGERIAVGVNVVLQHIDRQQIVFIPVDRVGECNRCMVARGSNLDTHASQCARCSIARGIRQILGSAGPGQGLIGE